MKPATFAECIDLSLSPSRLRSYLRARLVELTLQDASVAVRAIELLSGMGFEGLGGELDDVPASVLLDARERATRYLKSVSSEVKAAELAVAQQTVRVADVAMARRDFLTFCKLVSPNFVVARHHAAMAACLDKIVADYANRGGLPHRFYFGLPPRHGKSEMMSVLWPAFYLGLHPDHSLIHVSYASALSNTFSRRVRALVRDSLVYREIFPEVALDPERARVDDWRLTAGGGFMSVGVQGGITGHGCHGMIIDDPIKEGDAESPATLDAIFDWYTTAARTRLEPGGWIVFPMTRWHPRDLAGQLFALESQEGADRWEKLIFPALAEENDPLGRLPGEALWADRFDVAALNALKAQSERQFLALFQQNPRGSETKLFDAAAFVRVEKVAKTTTSSRTAVCFDLALTTGEESDYTAWAFVDYDPRSGVMHFSKFMRLRAEWPQIKVEILKLLRAYKECMFVFDHRSFELMAVQDLQVLVPDARIVSLQMKGDKRARAAVLSDRVAAGNVCVVGGSHSDEFIREHDEFDAGRHDDFVDMSSLAAHHFGLHQEFGALVSRHEKRVDLAAGVLERLT